MENRKKSALLLIDYQNDFTDPSGSLFVPNANSDVDKICEFIKLNGDEIDYICASMDSHQVIDIAHPKFWVDKNGHHPDPFTQVTLDNLNDLTPVYYKKDVVDSYFKRLYAKNGITHTIWPEHCIIGSWGWQLDGKLKKAIDKWGGHFDVVIKGTNPMTEHYGIFEAEITSSNAPETQMNRQLMHTLQEYDKVYLAGEAKSHCVATSLNQILDNSFLYESLVILEDTMSSVPGFETISEPIYNKARGLGVQFINSTEGVLA